MGGEYTIAGGLTDAQRLARQAQVMAAATEGFLSRVGLASGWSCLDVGCGDGQVTITMAKIAGESGRAVGVDVDSEALELASEAAARAGVRAEFVHEDAADPVEPGGFDLAYARLLLSHLVDPATAVRAMCAEARPGGAVAVEDLFLGTLRSDPPAPALVRLQEVYGATVRFHGGDPTIGPRLRALLAAGGLEKVREQTVTNPMQSVDEKLVPGPACAQHARLDPRGGSGERGRGRRFGVKRRARGPQPRRRLLPGAHTPGVGDAPGVGNRPVRGLLGHRGRG